MEWIVLTVLCLCLPVWSDVKVIQPYRVVSVNGTAQVQCFIQPRPSSHQSQTVFDQSLSYTYPEELRVTLLKGLHGTQELCSSILNFTEKRDTAVEKGGGVQCSAQVRGDTVVMTVSGLKATDTDIYRCEIEVFYPPPYLQITGNGTLIHVPDSSDCPVLGAHSQIAHRDDEEEDDEGDELLAPVSVPVVVLTTLVICVLIIIISFQTVQCKQGRREIIRSVPAMLHKPTAPSPIVMVIRTEESPVAYSFKLLEIYDDLDD